MLLTFDLRAFHNNQTHQMECSLNLMDLFHMCVWGKAYRKPLKSGVPFQLPWKGQCYTFLHCNTLLTCFHPSIEIQFNTLVPKVEIHTSLISCLELYNTSWNDWGGVSWKLASALQRITDRRWIGLAASLRSGNASSLLLPPIIVLSHAPLLLCPPNPPRSCTLNFFPPFSVSI